MAQGVSQPIGLGLPSGAPPDWWNIVWAAWSASAMGDIGVARMLYGVADNDISQGVLNAGLSVLRHNIGPPGEGSVNPVSPTETQVVTMFMPPQPRQRGGRQDHEVAAVNEDYLGEFITGLRVGHHRQNISVDRPHAMVMSTGRCGTMSLFRLFQEGNLTPYHTYWFMTHPYDRFEMLCRLMANEYGDLSVVALWTACRAAEWLGEYPMIGINHSDTVYAPVFAAIHPEARFVYLRRDPEKVFESFRTKKQWVNGNNHFRPVMYSFNGQYQYSIPPVEEDDGIRWHIEFTEVFSRAFGRVMGHRWIEISSDRLFGQDREEIAKLLEFTGSDIDIDVAVEHFGTKINEKAFKVA